MKQNKGNPEMEQKRHTLRLSALALLVAGVTGTLVTCVVRASIRIFSEYPRFTSIHGFKDDDDLVFRESNLAQSDDLRRSNQYVGRSLKGNGSFLRGTTQDVANYVLSHTTFLSSLYYKMSQQENYQNAV